MDYVDILRKKVAEIRNAITSLKNEGKMVEAHARIADLKNAEAELLQAEEVEEATRVAPKNLTPVPTIAENKISANAVFNKLLMGENVTEEEMNVYNKAGAPGQVEAIDEKGGYIVPTEQAKEIIEAKRKRVSLKALCTVVEVTTNKGTVPTTSGEGELIAFDELNTIAKSDIDFGQIEYNTKDYGDIIPVSNSLLEDTNVNLIGHIKKRFARKSVNTENKKILEIMNAAAKVEGDTWKTLLSTLNKGLDTEISANAVIVTNQTSHDWLDGLTDANGKPLLTPDLANQAVQRFRGRKIVPVPDSLIPDSGKMDFFVGDMEEAITFYERKGISIAISKEAGFTSNSTLLRAVERFDVKAVDMDALKHVVITPKAPK